MGLAFSCLLEFSQGQVDRYKMSIVEKGTPYTEQIEVDEKQDFEIFRVPGHNDIDGADFYHDFKTRVTVTKVPTRMACFIAKMDPSMPSPGKLKADLDRAASQSNQLPVTAQEHNAVVTGPADRSKLTKEILDFCGNLPIYNTENSVNPIKNENGTLTLIQKPTRRLRRQLPDGGYTSCLASLSEGRKHPTQNVRGCIKKPSTWRLQCRFTRLSRNCHFYATCTRAAAPPNNPQQSFQWICTSKHLFGTTLYSYCCDFVCPSALSPVGRK